MISNSSANKSPNLSTTTVVKNISKSGGILAPQKPSILFIRAILGPWLASKISLNNNREILSGAGRFFFSPQGSLYLRARSPYKQTGYDETFDESSSDFRGYGWFHDGNKVR